MDTEMPELQAQKAHAVVAFTGDYIGFTSNRKAVMIRNGVVYYDRNETTTLAVMPDGTLQFFDKGETTAKQLLDQGVKDSFSFGPLLVKDGSVILRLRDNCEKFDLKEQAETWAYDPEHPERNIGIHMIMRVAKDVSYTNTMNTNNLIITV